MLPELLGPNGLPLPTQPLRATQRQCPPAGHPGAGPALPTSLGLLGWHLKSPVGRVMGGRGDRPGQPDEVKRGPGIGKAAWKAWHWRRH